MLQYDRSITISAGASRRATVWQAQTLLISELWDKLKVPARGTETLAEYMSLKKAQQDDLKDIGGFVGGTLNGPRRKANNVAGRDIIILDLDNIPAGHKDNVLRIVEALGCGYCIYSTRKHQPAAPRLRVLFPLDRTVTADEYEPIARKAAEYIGLEYADPTTFEPSRLMYWPSCCRDSEYVYVVGDKPFLSADGLLAQYADWHDMTLWPALPGQAQFTKLAVKQGDPEGKNGVVGAFCRTYDIQRAMDELLPGIYEPVDNSPGRYTYLGGSTTGGAVLYDDGKFLYSHHATDPCGGRLVNAFDLVRLHKYGDLDDTAAALAKTKLRVCVYKGTEDEDAWNAGKVDVLLVHPSSCAYGLNLQAGGRHIIWFTPNWSFELNDQGKCRLWRQGSPYDKVYVHYLIVQGCVDEDVLDTIRERAGTHETVMQVLKARIKKIKEAAG